MKCKVNKKYGFKSAVQSIYMHQKLISLQKIYFIFTFYYTNCVSMLTTQGLQFQYNNDNIFHFPDVAVNAKESLLLLGKSGIGKTTLLHLLGGLMKPLQGKIMVANNDITAIHGRSLDKFRGKNIGIVFQQNHFVDALTVIENILLAPTLIGLKADKERATNLLNRLGLSGKENKKINQLSQGERQRCAIARAIFNKPQLILADEPTSALDDDNCVHVYNLLQEQAAVENAALVIVTHDTRLKNLITNQIILQ
jgi:lipoprotein-releasing system ATP-binding protein